MVLFFYYDNFSHYPLVPFCNDSNACRNVLILNISMDSKKQTVQILIRPSCKSQARGYKTFFMLNSAEHEIYPAHKC